MAVHIRIVTPVIPTGLTQASDFEGILDDTDRVTFTELTAGPASVESEFDEAIATPGVIARVIEAEEEGADAVVIDCMGDPGLRASREAVSIPVLGPCETSMHIASTLGRRFSVLAVSDAMGAMFEMRARLYGTALHHVSTRSVDIAVLDLETSGERLAERLRDQAVRAVRDDRADTIILGCTGMKGVAWRLQQDLAAAGLPAPVIDPIPLTLRVAKSLVACGIGHSKLAFPSPRPKPLRGFEGSAVERFREHGDGQ